MAPCKNLHAGLYLKLETSGSCLIAAYACMVAFGIHVRMFAEARMCMYKGVCVCVCGCVVVLAL